MPIFGGISDAIFGDFWIFGTPILILNLIISNIVSKMFFVLPVVLLVIITKKEQK